MATRPITMTSRIVMRPESGRPHGRAPILSIHHTMNVTYLVYVLIMLRKKYYYSLVNSTVSSLPTTPAQARGSNFVVVIGRRDFNCRLYSSHLVSPRAGGKPALMELVCNSANDSENAVRMTTP